MCDPIGPVRPKGRGSKMKGQTSNIEGISPAISLAEYIGNLVILVVWYEVMDPAAQFFGVKVKDR